MMAVFLSGGASSFSLEASAGVIAPANVASSADPWSARNVTAARTARSHGVECVSKLAGKVLASHTQAQVGGTLAGNEQCAFYALAPSPPTRLSRPLHAAWLDPRPCWRFMYVSHSW